MFWTEIRTPWRNSDPTSFPYVVQYSYAAESYCIRVICVNELHDARNYQGKGF